MGIDLTINRAAVKNCETCTHRAVCFMLGQFNGNVLNGCNSGFFRVLSPNHPPAVQAELHGVIGKHCVKYEPRG